LYATVQALDAQIIWTQERMNLGGAFSTEGVESFLEMTNPFTHFMYLAV
jgi:hypothetical protein